MQRCTHAGAGSEIYLTDARRVATRFLARVGRARAARDQPIMHCYNDCASKADNLDRGIDLYHWSSAKFCSAWRGTISVLVARGRAQVGVHAAKSDWSKRIRDFQFMDYGDHATHH